MRTANPAFPSEAEARELLARVIEASGLSARAWAESMGRDERTVRRWISGQIAIPSSTIRYLEAAWAAVGDVEFLRRGLSETGGLSERRRLGLLEAFLRLHPTPGAAPVAS